MKILLIAIVLLSGHQFAYADITLTFNDPLKKTSDNSIIYSIKNHQLKFTTAKQDITNIYNAKTEELVSLQSKTAQQSILNKQRLNQHVNQLNKERIKTLTKVEANLRGDLANMTTAQQETAETLINLYKYPEFYGEHTSLIIKPMNRSKLINGISCQVYHLYKLTDLLKSFCFAEPKSLKISTIEYNTLRSFYRFNYMIQSQILIAKGDTKFTFIDYDQHNIDGVLIEEINYRKSANTEQSIASQNVLEKINNSMLKNTDFSLSTKP